MLNFEDFIKKPSSFARLFNGEIVLDDDFLLSL